ncbi:MAG: hypothetical protein M1823_004902 [Watsoniomyces obsoletus]|nr:MAG: hypothetical protein M1823_004902 [Watsoniomyces obsoletus]
MPPRIPLRPVDTPRRVLANANIRYLSSSPCLHAYGAFPSPPPRRHSERPDQKNGPAPTPSYAPSIEGRLNDMEKRSSATLNSLEKTQRIQDLEKQFRRRWHTGDIYAPHDLSSAEAKKWKIMTKPTLDAFDVLGVNPLDEYKNFSILSEYITSMGRIKHSSDTGLRNVNQRRIAKAIRRAIGMGLIPSVHLHPELLLQIKKAQENVTSSGSGAGGGGGIKIKKAQENATSSSTGGGGGGGIKL